MNRKFRPFGQVKNVLCLSLLTAGLLMIEVVVSAQTPEPVVKNTSSSVASSVQTQQAATAPAQPAATTGTAPSEADSRVSEKVQKNNPQREEDPALRSIYRRFHETYRLGPEDEIAIRVLGHADYSVEKTRISGAGRVFHPLLGDVEIAGLTVPQLTTWLTDELSEYVINPRVSVSLLEARSARIGVLGEVIHPGVIVMNAPMNVLEAITAAGGISDTGRKSNVTLLRQQHAGVQPALSINVKRLLEGRASAEENLPLQAGDVLIVHGNTKKALSLVGSITGFAGFLTFLGGPRR